jgi:hypothetical protein
MQTIDTLQLAIFFQIKKKERAEGWREKGDAAINHLSAEYNKLRLEPEVADNQLIKNLLLEFLSIIELAADAGNAEAKRRNLDTSLWAEMPPATIWAIADTPLLRTTILRTIAKKFAKRPWYKNYLAGCLREASNLHDAIQIVEIALFSLGDRESTWGIILEPCNRNLSIEQRQWFGFLLNRIIKKVKLNPQYLSTLFAHQIKLLIIDQVDLAGCNEIKNSVAEMILAAMAGRPVLCLSASHLALLWSCKPDKPLDVENKAVYKKIFEKLTQTVVDVSLLPCDDSTKVYLDDIWTTTAQFFYSSEKVARTAIASVDKTALTALLDQKNHPKNMDSIEKLVSEISDCWSVRTKECFNSTPSLQNLDGILAEARKRYGITEITPSNDTVIFDPIAHHIISSSTENLYAKSVRVIKPGYIKYRENGSFKVIRKALVEIKNE